MNRKAKRDIPRRKRKVVALHPSDSSLKQLTAYVAELVGNSLIRGAIIIPVEKDGTTLQREVFGDVTIDDILIAGSRLQTEFSLRDDDSPQGEDEEDDE